MIFLTGMMGSGKTTVGRLLAKKLGWRFKDTDAMIEKISGKTVYEIFRMHGERGFRRMESEALRSLEGGKRIVVATGGGAVLKALNRAWMRKQGLVFFLDLPVAVIMKRLKTRDLDIRPLLKGGAAALTVFEKKRRPFYKQAQFTIRASGSAKLVAGAILLKIKEKTPLVLHDKTAR